MKNIYIIIISCFLHVQYSAAQTTNFQWLTASNNGYTITETLNGITATFTGTNDITTDMLINSPTGFCGSSNNVAWEITLTTAVTISFSQPVDVISLLAMNGNALSNTYTFNAIGGSNTPVVVNILNGCAPTVNLNWTNVSSIIVTTPTNNQFGFDNILVTPACTPTYGNDVQTACESFTWIDGNIYTTSNNTATHTLTNAAGCDSIVTLDLTVNYPSQGTAVVSACNSYTWIDGNTYTTSNNTATHILTNAAGCDSLITLDLTINSVSNITTTTNGLTISSNNSNASYQWLDCANNYAVIPGETSQNYVATANGSYAVQLTQNGCVDTSACVAITTVGIMENTASSGLRLYPNPANGSFTINLGSVYEDVDVTISDVFGRTISTNTFNKEQVLNFNLQEPAGVYFVSVSFGGTKKIVRLIYH